MNSSTHYRLWRTDLDSRGVTILTTLGAQLSAWATPPKPNVDKAGTGGSTDTTEVIPGEPAADFAEATADVTTARGVLTPFPQASVDTNYHNDPGMVAITSRKFRQDRFEDYGVEAQLHFARQGQRYAPADAWNNFINQLRESKQWRVIRLAIQFYQALKRLGYFRKFVDEATNVTGLTYPLVGEFIPAGTGPALQLLTAIEKADWDMEKMRQLVTDRVTPPSSTRAYDYPFIRKVEFQSNKRPSA